MASLEQANRLQRFDVLTYCQDSSVQERETTRQRKSVTEVAQHCYYGRSNRLFRLLRQSARHFSQSIWSRHHRHRLLLPMCKHMSCQRLREYLRCHRHRLLRLLRRSVRTSAYWFNLIASKMPGHNPCSAGGLPLAVTTAATEFNCCYSTSE